MGTINVWTDGSCLNNGKSEAASAFGVYYKDNDERNYASLLEFGRHTNNKAELTAIMYAMIMDFQEHHLTIHTDSQYSINCLTKFFVKWQRNGYITSSGAVVQWADLIKFILSLMEQRKKLNLMTELVYVKAHSTDPGNNAVDLLARVAASSGSERGRVKLLRKCGVPI